MSHLDVNILNAAAKESRANEQNTYMSSSGDQHCSTVTSCSNGLTISVLSIVADVHEGIWSLSIKPHQSCH